MLDQYLKSCPVIAILRGIKPDECLTIADTLYEAGVRIIEVPLNSPDPFESIQRLSAHFKGRAIIGAGTVLSVSDVEQLSRIGADIVIAPNFDPEVGKKAKSLGMIWLPGVLTPSEGLNALKLGADGLKLFPAEQVNIAVLKAWLSVFPIGTKIIPVGGVGASNSKEYLSVGAAGVGIGGSLFKPGDSVNQVKQSITQILSSL